MVKLARMGAKKTAGCVHLAQRMLCYVAYEGVHATLKWCPDCGALAEGDAWIAPSGKTKGAPPERRAPLASVQQSAKRVPRAVSPRRSGLGKKSVSRKRTGR
jgi:hypothetical protein